MDLRLISGSKSWLIGIYLGKRTARKRTINKVWLILPRKKKPCKLLQSKSKTRATRKMINSIRGQNATSINGRITSEVTSSKFTKQHSLKIKSIIRRLWWKRTPQCYRVTKMLIRITMLWSRDSKSSSKIRRLSAFSARLKSVSCTQYLAIHAQTPILKWMIISSEQAVLSLSQNERRQSIEIKKMLKSPVGVIWWASGVSSRICRMSSHFRVLFLWMLEKRSQIQ